jgi:regulator of nucleoside diphosphate kinase
MSNATAILLTELDAARLERSVIAQLLDAPDATQDADELEAILDEAVVVPPASMDPHVVTMNSIVVLEEQVSARRVTVTLVYPKKANPASSRVSVLSHLGCALIGARVGDVIEASVAGDVPQALIVMEILYQPESAGHFDL